MINQYFNVYALRRVRTAGYATGFCFFFKIIHNMVPSYLQEMKPEKQKPGRYMFRTKNDLVEPEWRITKYRKSFLPFATSLWHT